MEYYYLNKINSPQDLKNLGIDDLNCLAKEVRNEIIEVISKTGGHIASSLGVVELTIAIHKVFNCPCDKLVWDVGHQAYAHKILTGRKNSFKTIRQQGGISGFPRQAESEYDAFISGHSSTSISAACGIEKANEILGNNCYTIAVIGDGSLTGGLAYEGLNNVSKTGKEKLIVILNDNSMSISKNVGAIAKYLAKIRTAPGYFKIKDKVKNGISKLPFFKEQIKNVAIKSKVILKDSIYHSNVFENLGFEYLGPVNGHDINNLCGVLKRAQQLNKPVLIHVQTIKGKGLKLAEKNPSQYHGISKKNNDEVKTRYKDFSDFFGQAIAELVEKDNKIVVITAAMKTGTGLDAFSKKYPERFFDVGIAEQHAVTFASGLAANGCTPVFAVYSSFLQRGFDQIIHDAAIEKQHIILAIDRAGIVGEDGETHQGIFDVSFLSIIPNTVIFSPSNYNELKKYLHIAVYNCNGVVAVRYPRGKECYIRDKYNITDNENYHIWHEQGNKTLVITYGKLFCTVCDLKDSLESEGKNISILKLDKIWPIKEEIVRVALEFENIVFVEESIKSGGIAEHFGVKMLEMGYKGKYIIKAIENKFVEQSTVENSFKSLGFDVSGLEKTINKL